MRKYIPIGGVLTTLLLPFAIHAQSILVNPTTAPESSLSAEELTREVLIDGGECSDISNFTLINNPQAQFPNVNRSWGYFEKGESDFPFERGIVLTSGSAKQAEGPDIGNIVSYGEMTGWPGNSDATTLANFTTYNATIFEFDFIPYGNEIKFNYIFASEEYPDWVCGFSYNDTFGFIISGPGITNDPGLTGKNIALLPNGDPVTIQNVNNQGCGDDTYYVPGAHSNYFPYIEYGGRTSVLTAYSEVIPGETYHIRLLIADAGDSSYDSAVFLEAGSFSLGGTFINLEGVALGENEVLCDETEYTILVDLAIPTASFQWYFNGEEIPGATTDTYTATESGTYSCLIMANGCQTQPEVEIIFGVSPTLTQPENRFECTADGTYVFNLTDFNPEISADYENLTFLYYNSLEGAENESPFDEILNPNNFPVDVADGLVTVYVRVENEEGCYNIVPISVKVGIGPDTAEQTYTLCDEDGDNVAEFNLLTFAPNLVVSNPDDLAYAFYLDEDLTQLIPNPTTFENTSSPQVIYVDIHNPTLGDEACHVVEELTLFVNPFPATQSEEIVICDNLNDSSEFIDLTQGTIVLTEGITTQITYHLTEGGPAIPNPENFEITASTTTIYVLVQNEDATCERYETITITFDSAPDAVDDVVVLEQCSLSEYATYNLPMVDENLVEDTTGLHFTYYLTEQYAIDGVNQLPINYTNAIPDQIIFVRIENETGCFDVARVQLETVLIHNELPNMFTVCDDPYEVNDGVGTFDLTQRNTDIENSLGGTGFTISYYTSLEEALNGINAIGNPTNFQNTENPQIIYSRADTNSGSCGGIVEFQIEVLEVPEFEMDEVIYFCSSDLIKTYEYFGQFDAYIWYDSEGNVISNAQTVNITDEGIYTLEVYKNDLSCPARRDIEVVFDDKPIITNIQVDGHTVTISATGGYAPYQYSYNNGLTWYDHYILEDVPGGIYDLIVRSKYGCISTGKTFGVLGIPNVITPNGDGINDYWQIRGLEAYPDAHIKIFDRYGKLFVDRKLESGFKWDGKYLGNNIPSSDYWYIITLPDGKSVSGHITVRNQ